MYTRKQYVRVNLNGFFFISIKHITTKQLYLDRFNTVKLIKIIIPITA